MSDLNNDSNFEPFQPDDSFQPDEPQATAAPASTGNSRNFMIAIGIIGAIFLVGLIVMGIMAATILPQRQAAQKTQQAVVMADNAALAQAATEAVLAQMATDVPPTTPPTATLPPTNTPVVATPEPTLEPLPGKDKAETPDPAVQTEMAAAQAQTTPGTGGGQVATLAPGAARTATLAVLLTQVAAGNQQADQAAGGGGPTSTALPATGFADEVGLPGLFAAALGLIILILLARSLRLTTR